MYRYNTGISFSTSHEMCSTCVPVGNVKCIIDEADISRHEFFNPSLIVFKYRVCFESACLDDAISCLELVCAAKCVIDSYIEINIESLMNNLFLSEQERTPIWNSDILRCNARQIEERNDAWFYAIQIAHNAFENINERIALLKYYNARCIYDIHPMDLDPRSYEPSFCSLLDKLKIAYSIIDIHSIVEELGLEIRASASRPSVILHKWNPEVLSDLEDRLRKSSIDPTKQLTWLSRDECIRPFKTIVRSEPLCEWAEDYGVKDFNIAITDALLELDYQRDKLASHRVGERVQELELIDLENAFHLLRIILLDYFRININCIK